MREENILLNRSSWISGLETIRNTLILVFVLASLIFPFLSCKRADGPVIEDHQGSPVERTEKIIQAVYKTSKPAVSILDSGCDPTGKQMWHFAQLTTGNVVGISPEKGFPSESAVGLCGKNCSLLAMDGMKLEFPDNKFDVVLSNNVLEHVSDPLKYLQEIRRVLKNDGIAIIEFYPVWSGPRGHHIHADMIESWGGKNYRNDGSIIPDWSHLTYSPDEMNKALQDKMPPDLIEKVISYMFGDISTNGLNRIGWNTIRKYLEETFPHILIKIKDVGGVDTHLMPTDGNENYKAGGAWIIGSKERDLSFLTKEGIY